ncbi:Chaperone protein clpB [Pseudomonas knackmussii B13]|uniref:Chaperone protein clpB n=1 Tax=Pseudomonas knackmussii (strain DSM 6978 / CCUG 54928 / LMG 23759 / B13) TaxID=1301098 RepID=A0A024HG51_PSEKB|nr:Chaperone protein clpB [Pseudomonas knackmussii B13]
MPLDLPGGARSAFLWEPGCDTVEEAACSKALGFNSDRDLPVRPGFIGQLLQFSDHKMTDSYIPNAWAVLRRWQRALDGKATLVAEIERQALKAQLEDVKQRLQQVQRELAHTPGKPADKQAPITAQNALSAERGRLEESLQRLDSLRFDSPTRESLYGDLAEPMLEQALERWLAHASNHDPEPLAMIPPKAANEYWAIPAGPLDFDKLFGPAGDWS